MRKKLLLLFVSTLIICSVSAVSTVFAGINVDDVAQDGILDGAGQFNSTQFAIKDDTEPSAFQFVKGNTSLAVKAGGASPFNMRNAIPRADIKEDSKLTCQLDITQNGGQIWIMPFNFTNADPANRFDGWNQYVTKLVGNKILFDAANVNYPKGIVKVSDGNGQALETTGGGWYDAGVDFYSDAALKQANEQGRDHITLWFEADTKGTLTIYYGYDGHDGKEVDKKIAYVAENATTFFDAQPTFIFSTMTAWGTVYIDNYSVTESHMEAGELKVKSYGSLDFSDPAQYTGDTAPFVVTAGTATPITDSTRVIVKNPKEDTRIVSLKQLSVSDEITDVFDLEAQLKVNALDATAKAGFAFGLKNNLSRPSESCSMIYLTGGEDGLYLGAQKDGTAIGDLVKLDGITVGGEYAKLAIHGSNDGKAVVKVNGAEVATFSGLEFNGRVALTHLGTGEISYDILPAIKIFGYTFDKSEGGKLVNNFNTGYINSDNYTIVSNNAYNIAEGAVSNGVYTDEGSLFFDGTGTHSRIAFNKPYSDFVLQVDYTSLPISERIKIPTTGRYSPFAVVFGLPEAEATWSEGYISMIHDGHNASFYGASSLCVLDGKWVRENHKMTKVTANFAPGTENDPDSYLDKDGKWVKENPLDGFFPMYNRTTRVKIVAVNNNVAWYIAPVNQDGTAGEYVLAYQGKVSRTNGYVAIASDDPASFRIDNLCITPITDQALALGKDCTVDQVVYEDILPSAIPDEKEPQPIAQPEVKVNGNVLSWNAVENAEKYAVSVRVGDEKAVVTETTELSYTFTETKIGEYKISVQAMTTKEGFIDSLPSKTVIIKIEPQKLTAPEVKVEGSKVLWNKVDGASKYIITYKVGEETKTVETTELTYTFENDGEYKVTVKAVAGDAMHVDSDASKEVSVSVSSGCSSNLTASVSVVMLALVASVIIFSRKRKENF